MLPWRPAMEGRFRPGKARVRLGKVRGEVEDKGRKVLVEGINEWGPKEGDQRKGATAERADERSSSLIDGGRRKEEMTTGPTTR